MRKIKKLERLLYSKRLYQAFLLCLEHPKLIPVWKELEPEINLGILLSCLKNRPIPTHCYSLVEAHLNQLYPFCRSHSFEERYTVYQILLAHPLYSKGKRLPSCGESQFRDFQRNQQVLYEGIKDPDARIRILLARRLAVSRRCSPEQRETLYNKLLWLSLNDPLARVRRQAAQNLRGSCGDLLDFGEKDLSPHQLLHMVGLLNPQSQAHRQTALRLLHQILSSNSAPARLEFELYRFLERSGEFPNILRNYGRSFPEAKKLTARYLERAIAFSFTGITETPWKSLDPETLRLLIHLQKLAQNEEQFFLTASHFLEKIRQAQRFPISPKRRDPMGDPGVLQLLAESTEALSSRRTQKLWLEITEKAFERDSGSELGSFFLTHSPIAVNPRGALSTFLKLLRKKDFQAFPALLNALAKLGTGYYLYPAASLLSELESDPAVPRPVLERILLALIHSGEPQILRFVLERVSLLNERSNAELKTLFADFPPEAMEQECRALMSSYDSGLCAQILRLTAALELENLIDTILECLNDDNPNLRCQAFSTYWRLVTQNAHEAEELWQARFLPLLLDRNSNVRKTAVSDILKSPYPGRWIFLMQLIEQSEFPEEIHQTLLETAQAETDPNATTLTLQIWRNCPPLRKKIEEILRNQKILDAANATILLEHLIYFSLQRRDSSIPQADGVDFYLTERHVYYRLNDYTLRQLERFVSALGTERLYIVRDYLLFLFGAGAVPERFTVQDSLSEIIRSQPDLLEKTRQICANLLETGHFLSREFQQLFHKNRPERFQAVQTFALSRSETAYRGLLAAAVRDSDQQIRQTALAEIKYLFEKSDAPSLELCERLSGTASKNWKYARKYLEKNPFDEYRDYLLLTEEGPLERVDEDLGPEIPTEEPE